MTLPKLTVAVSSTSAVVPRTVAATKVRPAGAVISASAPATVEPAVTPRVPSAPPTPGTGTGGSGAAVTGAAPSVVAAPASEVGASPESQSVSIYEADDIEPFVFVVWLPKRGATAVSSAPFAAAVNDRHDRVLEHLRLGLLARWDDPFSQWFPVWWRLASAELSTVPRLAYAAQQQGLAS